MGSAGTSGDNGFRSGSSCRGERNAWCVRKSQGLGSLVTLSMNDVGCGLVVLWDTRAPACSFVVGIVEYTLQWFAEHGSDSECGFQ
jgi:hypothetical protein